MPGPEAKPHVTVARIKTYANPYDADYMPSHLLAGITQYILHAVSIKSLPDHVTTDGFFTSDILLSLPPPYPCQLGEWIRPP